MSTETGSAIERFETTPGGAVARGRRALHLFWGGLAVVLLAVTVYCWVTGRIFPGILGAGLTALAVISLRMSSDAEALWLEVGGGELVVQLRGGRERMPLAETTSRRLAPEEIEHVGLLASSAGIVKGWGGYDSHRLGEIELHATDLGNAVLVESEERKLLVTPDEPDALLARLTKP